MAAVPTGLWGEGSRERRGRKGGEDLALKLIGGSERAVSRRPGVGAVAVDSVEERDVEECFEVAKTASLTDPQHIVPDKGADLDVLEKSRPLCLDALGLGPRSELLLVRLHERYRAVHGTVGIDHDAACKGVDVERIAVLALHVL